MNGNVHYPTTKAEARQRERLRACAEACRRAAREAERTGRQLRRKQREAQQELVCLEQVDFEVAHMFDRAN